MLVFKISQLVIGKIHAYFINIHTFFLQLFIDKLNILYFQMLINIQLISNK